MLQQGLSLVGRKLSLKIFLSFLCFLLITTTVLAAVYNCIPCKENHYCIRGIRYECPIEKPVTIGGSKGSESDCMTCLDREGEAKPVYADYMGKYGECISCLEQDLTKPIWNGTECISCETIDSSKPIWNGTECTTCPADTTWISVKQECVSILATACTEDEDCAYKINHDGGILYLMESAAYTTFDAISPRSAEEETEEFLATYGIQNVSSKYPDRWAGAMKYCQDKGYRLPTMQELISISKAVYGEDHAECKTICSGSSEIGCCHYSNLTVIDRNLFNFLLPPGVSGASLWSCIDISASNALYRYLTASVSQYYGHSTDFRHRALLLSAICVK